MLDPTKEILLLYIFHQSCTQLLAAFLQALQACFTTCGTIVGTKIGPPTRWTSLREQIGLSHTNYIHNLDLANNLKKVLTTGIAKDATPIVMSTTQNSHLLFGWLATPLTCPSMRDCIYGDRTIKLIALHRMPLSIINANVGCDLTFACSLEETLPLS